MKKLFVLVVSTLLTVVLGCSIAPEEPVNVPVESSVELAGKPGGSGGSCPQYLQCPSSIPGYDTFMYAFNYNPAYIQCWYRNGSWGTASTTLTVPSACPHCCAPGYCPDERYGMMTYSMSWTCNQ